MSDETTGRRPIRPGVSYVMPVLNDVVHVRAAVDSLLAQDYDGPFDVTIALGPSIDGTTELLAELSSRDPRVRVIENPIGSTPSGLNLAIQASAHPVVVRVDAHSVLPPHYTRVAVETLQRSGADNVGGIMDAQGVSAFERAVAAAYGSRLGLGGTPHHVGGPEGPADTVYLGVFRRERLTEVGLFDEEIKRGQDWELNKRIREAGGVVWFTPELTVTYRPRSSLSRLARQFFSTGLWRGELVRRYPSANGLRYWLPPILVIGLVLGTLLGVGGVVQAALGAPPFLLLGFAAPLGYLLLVLIAAVQVGRGHGPAVTLRLVAVLPCIHCFWGMGFILGALSLTRDIAAHTGR